MKSIFLFLALTPLFASAQFKVTKNDALIAAFQFISGAADGLREEVLYHPNNLFEQHPNLNRQWWDSRISWKNKETRWVPFSDANHTLRIVIQTTDIFTLTLPLFEKMIPAELWAKIKMAFKKGLFAYAGRKAGFHAVYTLHFKNH